LDPPVSPLPWREGEGDKKANSYTMNLASIRSLSEIEVPRISKALGIEKEKTNTFEELKEVIDGLFGVVRGKFMQFKYFFPSENCMQWEMQRCFAYEGVKRSGVIDQYRCGILYRVKCWFDILGLKYTLTPPLGFCLMHNGGKCSGEIRFCF